MSQPSDLLARAGRILREAPEPGWDSVAARVAATVRGTSRVGGWPLRADGDDRPGPGHLFVNENVLRSTLAVTLRETYVCAPTAVEFDVVDGSLRGVRIEVTGSYGTELRELADHLRSTAAEIIGELIGPAAERLSPIDVAITNVVDGNPARR